MLKELATKTWDEFFSEHIQESAISCLESGSILFFPSLSFDFAKDERGFLTDEIADPGSKNISYCQKNRKLWGIQKLNDAQRIRLKLLMDRYASHAFNLMQNLFPSYANHLLLGRTSYRPLEVSNRKTSYKKDDKRLHVDAFPSAPNQGKRILRVFTNVNPFQEMRVWRVGEDFERVINKFLPDIRAPYFFSFFTSAVLQFLTITKSKRSLYDHYMLQLHDHMKKDEHYQKNAAQNEISFPPGSSWIVQTDQVSHAAMKGRFVLEQTFYLPVNAMQDEMKSPLRKLEQKLNLALV